MILAKALSVSISPDFNDLYLADKECGHSDDEVCVPQREQLSPVITPQWLWQLNSQLSTCGFLSWFHFYLVPAVCHTHYSHGHTLFSIFFFPPS